MKVKDWIDKKRAKVILQTVFKNGDIGISYSYGQTNGKIYPKIHSVKFDYKNKCAIYVFTLPVGLDPKEIKKKLYCFQQVFGKNIELTGEIKKFTLTVFTATLKEKIKYDYKELLEVIQENKFKMPIVAGKDQMGKLRIYDATGNPNLLIFGEPGSGKSSILHVILTTLIQYFQPRDMHLHLADFKQSELSVYEGVEHVNNGSISYEVKKFGSVLKRLKQELFIRGNLLKQHRIRHINKLPKDKKPPYIVLCVDEFVMIKDQNIMSDLLQIASLGRAYGIYVILSMQRPSHSILSTDVRGMLSVRMGFRTVDRRNAMIGETPGSEKLSKEEPGKFIFNLDDLAELKAPYLDEDEVEKIIEPYKAVTGENSKELNLKNSDKEYDTVEIKENLFGVLDE